MRERQDKYCMKYGIIKSCSFCKSDFETKPRFTTYCSTPCKNPLNRPGHPVWNAGLKLSTEQKSKQNISGLSVGRGWNKGKSNEDARQRFLDNNPNKDGRLNNLRPRNYIDTEFTAYIRECKKVTYRSVYAMKKEGIVPKTGKKKTDMQLDHIIPYKQGFELKIPSAIIGGRKNLRYILGKDNREKWDKYQNMDIIRSIAGEEYVI